MNRKIVICTPWRSFSLFTAFALLILCTCTVSGQTQTVSIPAGSGTLTYHYQVQSGNCGSGPTQTSAYMWSNFSFTPSGGGSTSLGGSIFYLVQNPPCAPVGGWDSNGQSSTNGNSNELAFSNDVIVGDQSCAISFYASEGSPEGSANLTCVNPAIAYPKYKVTSIIYDAPGNRSVNGFVNSTTDGTRTSVGSNFETGSSTTYSYGGGLPWLGRNAECYFWQRRNQWSKLRIYRDVH